MEAKEKRDDVEKAKEVLKKMDPELAVMAISQSEVDFKEVDKIKETLSKFDAKAVQYAIAEVQQEVTSREIYRIKDQLKAFGSGVLKAAAIELGYASRFGLCFEDITCQGRCIMYMSVRCKQDMFVKFSRGDEVINPGFLEGIIDRGMSKALNQAKSKGEL